MRFWEQALLSGRLVAGVCARMMNLTGNILESRVTSKMVLESGEGGWDQKTLSQLGLRLLWLGKADEGRGVSADPSALPAGHHSDA
mgnify:CR=1 FL=1